ncbi:GNAT family N-acetyltransferase [Glycomyces harbinensis]|uniref:Ribosomal protein S18 acetylase RimI n=1 Tax=Glycomyces harbinensis TaxID=58114 RepID=A0A1G6R1I0_9ACTN|nr:GNAT family N-acetyltransferase [Glycomyces harbinensis]SDC98482.1 Ribosomal protein S18 acetylase RimI [Glycomyces harbinensis]
MSEVEVREVEPAELPAVAGLRWRWQIEAGDEQTVDRETFERAFTSWAQEAAMHRCVVAVRDREVIGMAWMALTHRVPTPQVLDRTVGDVQSVYVIPEARGQGLGSRLMEAVLAIADALGLERVTVHSTTRAVPVYRRMGFAKSHRLMQFEPEPPPADASDRN